MGIIPSLPAEHQQVTWTPPPQAKRKETAHGCSSMIVQSLNFPIFWDLSKWLRLNGAQQLCVSQLKGNSSDPYKDANLGFQGLVGARVGRYRFSRPVEREVIGVLPWFLLGWGLTWRNLEGF